MTTIAEASPKRRERATTSGSDGWEVRRQLLAAAGILGLALALRLIGLDRRSVWFDEAVTYFNASLPWEQLIPALRDDVHPPLSYAVFHLWPMLSHGDFWLRFPPAILGAAAAPGAWAWARRIGTETEAAFTGLFVAATPFLVDLSQEARMYGLMLFLTASTLYLLDRVLTRTTWLDCALYALAAAALLYTHYYGAFILAGQGAAAVTALRRGRAQGAIAAIVCLAVAGLLFVPWLPILVGQASGVRDDYWIEAPKLTTLWVTFRDLVAHTPPDAPLGFPLRVAYVLEAGVILFGVARVLKRPRQRPAVWVLVAPIGLALVVSLVVAPVYAIRYVSPTAIPLGFVLARGAMGLPRPMLRVAASAVVAFPILASLPPLYLDPGYSRADLRSAAAFVGAHRADGEVVLHLGDFTAVPFRYYGVGDPDQTLLTNDRQELCNALAGRSGWLSTAYQPDDESAVSAAEAGVLAADYAGALVQEAPARFLGVSVLHLAHSC